MNTFINGYVHIKYDGIPNVKKTMQIPEPATFYILDDNNDLVASTGSAWLEWCKNSLSKMQVGYTEINDEISISTIFYGSPELLFETGVFRYSTMIYKQLYNTWLEAKEGHNEVVIEAQTRYAKADPPDKKILGSA